MINILEFIFYRLSVLNPEVIHSPTVFEAMRAATWAP